MERMTPMLDVGFLSLVIASMTVFAATLAYYSWYAG
jgi:hypothetical protein